VIASQGWRIVYRVDPDDGGFPSLEFYATHRMTSDSHVRIWADGHTEGDINAYLRTGGAEEGQASGSGRSVGDGDPPR
jgi:hypothetical protein